VEIHSQITELSARSVKVSHSIRSAGIEVSSGWEIRGWVGVEGGSFKARPIPAEMRQRLT
jgi:acyl-CoA thioesterase FadM